jgi:signal peptidase II
VGNLTDRLISSRGVVDFIDVGIGDARFYTFNIADSAVTVGAILLAVISMRSNPATDAATETGGLKKEA